MFKNAVAIKLLAADLLFRESSEPGRIYVETPREGEAATDFQKIRCPHCRWQPRGESRWWCGDCAYPEFFFGGCGTGWNTFQTGGRCPGCRHQWKWTLCLRCHEWARHEDWYESKS